MRYVQTWLGLSVLLSVILGGCALGPREEPVAALDQLLLSGVIQVAEEHLQAQGLNPGPVDGIFTEQTAEALRQYQRRYGLPVSGLLDPATRQHLLPGIEKPHD